MWIQLICLSVDGTVVISINYHYRNVMFGVGCGIIVCMMVVDCVTVERNGKQNFS